MHKQIHLEIVDSVTKLEISLLYIGGKTLYGTGGT